MYLSKLLLQNFRSYQEKLFEFSPKANLVIGPNGSGKTNILEAIYFLASGKSFRATSQSKLINWQGSYASVRGKIIKNNTEPAEVEVRLIRDQGSLSISRKFYLDKVAKTRKVYLGKMVTVAFHPEDIRLVTGSPSRRRDFLDEIFATSEWRYAASLSQFNKALKHRNELLDLIRLNRSSPSELFYWDQSLIKNDQIIHEYRLNFIRHVNEFFLNHSHPEINTLSLNYHPSALSQDKLDANYNFDLARGYTQVGLHRDDFSFDNSIFPSPGKDLADWGSRGQQRLAVLALRLAQINFYEHRTQDTPILLLDDIFSELDPRHQQLVIDITTHYQSIFTAASLDYLPKISDSSVINI